MGALKRSAKIMKVIIPVLFLVAGMIRADDTKRDPFGPPPEKTAEELAKCVRGHKTLRDVPIVYGLIGGQTGSSDTAKKAKNGDVILGGCFHGPRTHWVVCSTCGLRFDDEYLAWMDAHPRDSLAQESKKNPKCTLETIRRVLSKELQRFTLEVAGADPSFLSCSRWHDSSGIVGEKVLVDAEVNNSKVLATLEACLRTMGAPEHPIVNPSDATDRTWKWTIGGKSYVATLIASGEDESFMSLEWHPETTAAEQDGGGQPATRSESK